MCKEMEGNRCVRTWKTQMHLDIGRCKCVRIQMLEDMGGCRYMKTWENADM
jgi:hypothetical protein